MQRNEDHPHLLKLIRLVLTLPLYYIISQRPTHLYTARRSSARVWLRLRLERIMMQERNLVALLVVYASTQGSGQASPTLGLLPSKLITLLGRLNNDTASIERTQPDSQSEQLVPLISPTSPHRAQMPVSIGRSRSYCAWNI